MNKLIDTLKTIYEKHPFLVVFFISMLLTLPWITMGEFYYKGEPREATVATFIMNTGNWILPAGYADEVAYKPPFMHWIIVLFSLPFGAVSITTARLPSALSLIGITLMTFVFLQKRKSTFVAVIASLMLLTSFEMHRWGIESRVDMLLAFLMAGALFSLYRWEEKGLKGYPLLIPVFLGGAALVKGPVGFILPCLVFAVYLLLLQRYSLWKIISKNILVAIPAVLMLGCWYVLAYRQDGSHFLNLVFAENIGRFLGMSNQSLGIKYNLGHIGPFWYYIPAIVVGFMPWSIMLIMSAFGIKYTNPFRQFNIKAFLQKLSAMDKVTLFSIVSIAIILLFYMIPASKRTVYIMPAYPFAAYLLVLLYDWAVNNKPQLIKGLGNFILGLSFFMLALEGIFRFVNLSSLVGPLFHDTKTLHDINVFSGAFQHPTLLAVAVWVLLLAAILTFRVVLKRKSSYSILFGMMALFVCLQVFLEGSVYPEFKDSYSSKSFAEKIQARYDLKGNTYVINDLTLFPNLYGLNFYTGNHFRNFEKELPSTGYFITGSTMIDQIRKKYAGRYVFEELYRSPDKFNDFNDMMIVYKIIKIGK
ncbi:MAG: glycosyltransferase family 39 protein [Paludibacter sp.]|nr:glycosyltransferase family 39 protein [Paludibacter sp.]